MMITEIEITSALTIPFREISFRFSRSGGPGGQHVNKTETKVELLFDVEHSTALNEFQRSTLMRVLGNRIDTAGLLHVVVSQERSQMQNKSLAVELFARTLAAALKPRKKRVATKPTKGSKERRMTDKKIIGAKKKLRTRHDDE